ncbi:PilZ domain-containing protein [Cystobacter ferrugineus]|uniref:PilZ domain-containing protein n=1 Tax=Cystobacter ferrugineus TaxID=83449 RepID=A0A1L9BBK1_9BACT|nr:PilZ domain-containing protein [Cystobacter ferrugineus]OJH39642.1 PilZ domain-containing protein [Cystobacter ferrugineus]
MERKGSRKKVPAEAVAPERPAAAPPSPVVRPEPPRAVVPPRSEPRAQPLGRPVSPFPARPASPFRFSSTPVASRPPSAPLIGVGSEEEVEHRRFPRAQLATSFELWIDEGGERRFTATLRSVNVSVGGAFLESTFFLPLSTELRVRFSLAPGAAPVEARALVVREQRSMGDEMPSGFGIHFEEFYGQTEVALARLFLDLRLRAFAEEYLASPRARGLSDGLERVVDALAAWELLKAHSSTDMWRGE